jgi:hypothetical protein
VSRFIAESNIERFETRLLSETHLGRRAILSELLHMERIKLAAYPER